MGQHVSARNNRIRNMGRPPNLVTLVLSMNTEQDGVYVSRKSLRRAWKRPMHDQSLTFLRRLLEPPSPSGYERAIQHIVRDWAGRYADEIRTDRHGNVIAIRHPAKKTADGPRIMLAGHCDQIGLMVQHID